MRNNLTKHYFLAGTVIVWSLVGVNSAVAQSDSASPFVKTGNTTGTWSQLSPSGPGPSTSTPYQTTNYDATNNRLIVYATEGVSAPAQVWVLTSANGLGGTPTWLQIHPTGTGPGNNGGATAVYDAAANQLIVYGGCSGSCGSPLDTVYVLTNANGLGGTPQWSQSSPTSSVPRTFQAAVYDPNTNSMITFGGELGSFGTDQNDTHVLSPANGSSPTWTTLAPIGGPPPIRDDTSAVYDAGHNRMIIFGGSKEISCCYNFVNYNDVWVLSNANGQGGTPAWTQLQTRGTPPAPRATHSAVYDATGNNMYVFGGESWSNTTQSYTVLGDVWKLSNANGLGSASPQWTQVAQLGTPPGGNFDQGAALDNQNLRMISHGGQDRNGIPHYLTFILDLP